MIKEIDRIYLDYCKKYLGFANDYADEMTQAFKDDVYTLFKGEYKKDITAAAKKESLRIKHMNEMLKIKTCAEKKVLRKRKGGVDYGAEPTIAEQVEAVIRKIFFEMFNIQNEPVEQPLMDDNDVKGEQSEVEEMIAESDETEQETTSDVSNDDEQEESETDEETGDNEEVGRERETSQPISEKKSSYWDGRRKKK